MCKVNRQGKNNEHVLFCLFKPQKLKRKGGGVMSGTISWLQKSDFESCHRSVVAKQHRDKVLVGEVYYKESFFSHLSFC